MTLLPKRFRNLNPDEIKFSQAFRGSWITKSSGDENLPTRFRTGVFILIVIIGAVVWILLKVGR